MEYTPTDLTVSRDVASSPQFRHILSKRFDSLHTNRNVIILFLVFHIFSFAVVDNIRVVFASPTRPLFQWLLLSVNSTSYFSCQGPFPPTPQTLPPPVLPPSCMWACTTISGNGCSVNLTKEELIPEKGGVTPPPTKRGFKEEKEEGGAAVRKRIHLLNVKTQYVATLNV